MPTDPNIAIEKLLSVESGTYRDDDHGRGPSRWGITLKTAQETHPDWTADTIRNLTKEGAVIFFTQNWWVRYHLYLIDDQTLADRMLNVTVNVGPGTGIKWLQKAIGLPVAQQTGYLGPVTAKATNSMDPEMVWNAVKDSARAHYQTLGSEYEDELAGLMNRVDQA